jgi:hypothetical protein
VHGYVVAGGSDIALCADMVIISTDAEIGYMPTRVWGCPTTAMWVYRLGPERAKRMLFTGDKISGVEAEQLGLVLKAVPPENLDAEVEALAERIATVPVNQLMMQKLVVNQAIEAMGLKNTQVLATIFDGITRHSPEALISRNGPKRWDGKRLCATATTAPGIGPRTGRSIRSRVRCQCSWFGTAERQGRSQRSLSTTKPLERQLPRVVKGLVVSRRQLLLCNGAIVVASRFRAAGPPAYPDDLRAAIADYLRKNKFNTIVGEVSLPGQIIDKNYTVGQWQGGLFRAVAGVGFSDFAQVKLKTGWA